MPGCLPAYLLQLSVCSYVCLCVDSKSLCVCGTSLDYVVGRQCCTCGVTALDLAVLADNKEIVQELVGLGAKGTVLTCHMAIQHDNAAMLDVLFFHFPALVIEDFHGWEVLQQHTQHCCIVMLDCYLACQYSSLCSKPNKLLDNLLVVCQHSQVQGTHAVCAHVDVCAMALQKLQLREVGQRRRLQDAQSVYNPLQGVTAD